MGCLNASSCWPQAVEASGVPWRSMASPWEAANTGSNTGSFELTEINYKLSTYASAQLYIFSPIV